VQKATLCDKIGIFTVDLHLSFREFLPFLKGSRRERKQAMDKKKDLSMDEPSKE